MEKLWSKFWKSSIQRRKQRKYLFNAPLNVKHRLLAANVSKELRKEYNVRSVPVRKGDTVSIQSGQFKNQSGKVAKVALSKVRVYVDNVGVKRSDGTLSMYPIHPSNLKIIKFDTTDKARVEKLNSTKKKGGEKKE